MWLLRLNQSQIRERELVMNGYFRGLCNICDESIKDHCADCLACFDDHRIDCELDRPRERVDYDQLILDSGQLPTGYLGELD
jgi:hypothetical protein